MLRREDTWAILLGALLLLIGVALYFREDLDVVRLRLVSIESEQAAEIERHGYRSLAWYELLDERAELGRSTDRTARAFASWIPKLAGWKDAPLEAFHLSAEAAAERGQALAGALQKSRSATAEALELALAAEAHATTVGRSDRAATRAAEEKIAAYRASQAKTAALAKKAGAKPYDHLLELLVFGAALAGLFAVAARFLHGSAGAFARGFPAVYLLAILAYWIGGQTDLKALGFGYTAWAIVLGLLLSNTIGTPGWLRPALQTELFIKVGLVLLGAEVLFAKVLVIGLPGLFVAWVVTPIVLVTTYLFGQYVLRIASRSLNMTLSADMSVCGVSAAIATAAACRAKREELTLAIGISMLFTTVMMVALPNLILFLGIDPIVGGAWIGGTIDATGAVAAAGAFLGDRALHVAATIKMIQNLLIGVLAFGVAVYWVTRVERDPTGPRPSAWEIWHRFPKFVFGFVGASIAASLAFAALGPDVGERWITHGVVGGWSKEIRGWLFALAFVSIGLSTDFRSLCHYLKDGKAVALYLCGQTFNLLLTLGAAWLMFRVLFADLAEGL